MHSRISLAFVVLTVIILTACSGAHSNFAPSDGSFTPSVPSQPALGRSALPLVRKNTVTETVLYTFPGSPNDGYSPYDRLIDVSGTLYGTAYSGGAHGRGTVFSMTTSGAETVLHDFTRGHGQNPSAGLTNVNGVLYGTTENGGTNDGGSIFRITTSGVEKQLYSFAGGADGEGPIADLTNVNGTLYGTTYAGGGGTYCIQGCGTIFKITAKGNETALHRFAGFPADGEFPPAGLADVNGTLYGITYEGGASDAGIVFSITTAGTYKQLHSFGGGSKDGKEPLGTLTDVGGKLYGTTFYGGAYGYGTVFRITTSGVERVLYSFDANGVDGYFPTTGLTKIGGILYGTTSSGGSSDDGTVFQISTGGSYTQLHSFSGSPTDGAEPYGSLIGVDGILYGTTHSGGVGYGGGTVFSLSGF
ncbi:MAG: choice-of-anchor tandem repeat GloVer-containing protein [Candidatus Tumulicola sp.]